MYKKVQEKKTAPTCFINYSTSILSFHLVIRCVFCQFSSSPKAVGFVIAVVVSLWFVTKRNGDALSDIPCPRVLAQHRFPLHLRDPHPHHNENPTTIPFCRKSVEDSRKSTDKRKIQTMTRKDKHAKRKLRLARAGKNEKGRSRKSRRNRKSALPTAAALAGSGFRLAG